MFNLEFSLPQNLLETSLNTQIFEIIDNITALQNALVSCHTYYVLMYMQKIDIITLFKTPTTPATECRTYNILNSLIRSTSNSVASSYCDYSLYHNPMPDWKGTSWYRFQSQTSSGKMPEQPIPTNRCGAHATGWLSTSHPSKTGESIQAIVCFNFYGETCKWQTDVTVTNCGSYFVYYLPDTNACSLAYCSSDS